MVDTFSKNERSEIMRSVKSKGNKSTELKLISFFRLHKITGWRRNIKLIGKPDFVFKKKRITIFVDGCFWHGHTCRNTKPKQNADYWNEKIKRNKKRDRDVTKELKNINWIVIRIWECEITDKNLKKKLFCLL
ncbi:MAG TPA: very short patch repair endonuclease [bacterium]|nr:very short patch repair endonuclease [bacterium]